MWCEVLTIVELEAPSSEQALPTPEQALSHWAPLCGELLRCATAYSLSLSSPATRRFRAEYIGEFEIVDDHRSGKIVVNLIGRLNKVGVISPRFDIQSNKIEEQVANLLPSRLFGHIVLTTTFGIMDHNEAIRKKTGGKILGFFY